MMNFLKKITKVMLGVVQLLFLASFILMELNIWFYFGFHRQTYRPVEPMVNPLGFEIWQIWAIHLALGLIGGMILNPKHYVIAGFCGLLAATLITGITFGYFGWRVRFEMLEVIVPLIFGIIPPVILHDRLVRRKKQQILQKQEN